jgi:hypothetical protein
VLHQFLWLPLVLVQVRALMAAVEVVAHWPTKTTFQSPLEVLTQLLLALVQRWQTPALRRKVVTLHLPLALEP